MKFLLSAFLVAFSFCSVTFAEDWPGWRGPTSNGVATGISFPTEWNADKSGPSGNIAWKYQLPGIGSSTPIVHGDRIFVTSGDGGKNALTCVSMDGKELWKRNIGTEDPGKHKKGTGANSSPVTDGRHVFAYFKSGDFGCFDLEGKLVWEKNLQKEFGEDTLWWDLGTSPFLTSKHVAIACVQTGPSYIVAFNRETGEVAWKVDRDVPAPEEAAQTYSTPIVAERDGIEVIYVLGADHVTAHRAEDGGEVWRVGGLNPTNNKYCRSIASPVLAGDILVAPYDRGGSITGIRLGGMGDVTKSHVAYTLKLDGKQRKADVPTPAADGENVIVCSDQKTVFCINAKTGENVWEVKIKKPRTTFSASPIIAGDRVYVTAENGDTFVISKSEQKIVAENRVGEHVVATPVLVDGIILIRADQTLFCIDSASGNRGEKG